MDPTGLEDCYPFDCAGDETDFDGPEPPLVVKDLGDDEAPSAPTDLVRKYLGDDQDAPTVGQMQAAGTYMPHVSPELNYELYFRERCGRDGMGTDMTCANFRKYYDNWAHVKSIDADSCPICGNIGFLAIVEYALGRGGKLGKACPNSFLPEAGVRMADGSVKEIGDIEVGDKVLATDPETGTTEARTVLATIITKEDKEFTGLTVKTGDGDVEIVATDHHPFWSLSAEEWIDAADLAPGMTLRTDTGTTATLSSVRSFREQAETRNLTVDGIHTYYVLAGDTPVLVHNATPTPSTPSGVVYLRTDIVTGEEYVGQAKSWNRYLKRQREHARDYPNKAFTFEVLGRANPGQGLDVLEESWMRAGGGKKTVPGSVLENSRVQMNDDRYRAAGGTIC